jgi:hypothetical protein
VSDLTRIIECARMGLVPAEFSLARALRELVAEIDRRRANRPPLTPDDEYELRLILHSRAISGRGKLALRALLTWARVIGSEVDLPAVRE